MGYRFDEQQVRADCAAAGITAEVTEIVVLRMRDDLLFNVIAKQLDPAMKPATVRQAYHRASERLHRFYQARAAQGTATPGATVPGATVAGPGEAEEGRLTRVEYAKTIFRCVLGDRPPSGHNPVEDLPVAERFTLDDVIEICDRANFRRRG